MGSKEDMAKLGVKMSGIFDDSAELFLLFGFCDDTYCDFKRGALVRDIC